MLLQCQLSRLLIPRWLTELEVDHTRSFKYVLKRYVPMFITFNVVVKTGT